MNFPIAVFIFPVIISISAFEYKGDPETTELFYEKFKVYEDPKTNVIKWTQQELTKDDDLNIVCTYMYNSDNERYYFNDFINEFHIETFNGNLWLKPNTSNQMVEVLMCKSKTNHDKVMYAIAGIKSFNNILTRVDKEHGGFVIRTHIDADFSENITKGYAKFVGVDKNELVQLTRHIPAEFYTLLCTQNWRDEPYKEASHKVLYSKNYKTKQGTGDNYSVNILQCEYFKSKKFKLFLGVTVNDVLHLLEVDKKEKKGENVYYYIKKGKYVEELDAAIIEHDKNPDESSYDWLDHSPLPDYCLKRACITTLKKPSSDPGTLLDAVIDIVNVFLMPFANNRPVEALKCTFKSEGASAPNQRYLLSTSKHVTFTEIVEQEDGNYIFKGPDNHQRYQLNAEFYETYIKPMKSVKWGDGAESKSSLIPIKWSDKVPVEMLHHKCHETLNQRPSMAKKFFSFYRYVKTVELGLLWPDENSNTKIDAIICKSMSDFPPVTGTLSPYDRNLLTPITVKEKKYAEIKRGKPFYLAVTTNKIKKLLYSNFIPERISSTFTLKNFTPSMKTACAKFLKLKNTDDVKDVSIHVDKLLLRPYEQNYFSEILSCEFNNRDKNFQAVFAEFDEDILTVVEPHHKNPNAYFLSLPLLDAYED